MTVYINEYPYGIRDSGLKHKKKYLSTLIRTHAPPKQLIRLLYIIHIERAAP